MNVIDVAVVLLILCAGVVGLKRGVFKELVMTVGLLIVYILAFKLKDPIANWLSINLPFFNFGGDFYGATALNILLYQAYCQFKNKNYKVNLFFKKDVLRNSPQTPTGFEF